MGLGVWLGAVLILIAGVLQGTFAVPMKYARNWNHENIWLIFALTGLVVFPWALTILTVPSLPEVYRLTSRNTLAAIIGSGIGWGVGATLTGLGLKMLGIGLGFAIILGLSASVGSLVPLLVLSPEKLLSAQGYLYSAGTAVMFAGIALVAVAGAMRERASRSQTTQDAAVVQPPSFAAGLFICIAAGVLSSMLNFSFAFGGEAIDNARQLGASSLWASNAASAPATTGGFLANLIYCVYALRRNGSTRQYWLSRTGSYWLFGILMGAFWYGGLALYGVGVFRMGEFGTVAGWPLLMGAIIISSNLAGFLTGEWRMAGHKARIYLLAGSGVILIALLVLAKAQQFGT